MKTRIILTTFMAVVAAVTIGAPTPTISDAASTQAKPKMNKAELRSAVYRATGGQIKDVREQKGKIVYVNCQDKIPEQWLTEHAELFSRELYVDFSVGKGSFSVTKADVQGMASVFVVADKDLPMSLISPEARWAMVNVVPLATDKEPFYKARVQKEIARCIALLCGAAGSQFPGALVEPIQKPADLDPYAYARLPYDLLQRIKRYLPGIGITPYKMVSYRKACQEGWAPAPTNDVQKEVWRKVHTLPSKPLTIKYDEKKGE